MNLRVLIGFSLSILLLIVLGMVSYQSIREFQTSAQKVSDSHRIQNALESLMSDLVSAESEARGYVIMGKEDYLNIYRKTVENTRQNLEALRALQEQTASPAAIQSLIQLIEKRLDRLRLTIEARQSEGLDGVVGVAGVGKRLMDQIRSAAQQLQNGEDAVLQDAAVHLNHVSQRTTWTIGLTGVLAVVFHLTSTVALSRSMTQRQRLERALLEAGESEQRRIGQELHDGICQQLTGISLMVRSLQNEKSSFGGTSLETIVDLLNGCIKETRQIIHGLHPVTDEPGGLQAGLQELALTTQRTHQIPCELEVDLPPLRLDAETASNLYRIAQESTRNAVKHSRCKRILIRLQCSAERLQLTVQDDGIGFNGSGRVGGFGLAIMKHRARNMRAILTVASTEGAGTRVQLNLPVHP